MKYSQAIERLQNHQYRVTEAIEVLPESRESMYIQVEVSPFSIYSQVERIKMLLPEMLVRSGGCNGGAGVITIQSRP